MHDRIPAGMANRTAVLTDENPYLERQFVDGKNICFYSLKHLHSLSEQAGKLLEDGVFRETIQQNAYEEFCEKHTWRCRAEKILKLADGVR